jgi:hypothetical protein
VAVMPPTMPEHILRQGRLDSCRLDPASTGRRGEGSRHSGNAQSDSGDGRDNRNTHHDSPVFDCSTPTERDNGRSTAPPAPREQQLPQVAALFRVPAKREVENKVDNVAPLFVLFCDPAGYDGIRFIIAESAVKDRGGRLASTNRLHPGRLQRPGTPKDTSPFDHLLCGEDRPSAPLGRTSLPYRTSVGVVYSRRDMLAAAPAKLQARAT